MASPHVSHLQSLAALATALAVASGQVSAQTPSTSPSLVDRASKVVDQFVESFSGVVAEEQYVQVASAPRKQRSLRSEFLLAKVPGSEDWYQFRDVIEVDGRPVPSRAERLAALFIEPDAAAFARGAEVTRRSAEFNVADIGSLNLPLTVLAFLQSRYKSQFRFTTGPLDPLVAPDARVVRFTEIGIRPLLRSSTPGIGLPTSGRIWISERSAQVLQTELVIRLGALPAEVITRFMFDSDLELNVPTEMRDRYTLKRGEMSGLASYGHFRRFGVQVSEEFKAR